MKYLILSRGASLLSDKDVTTLLRIKKVLLVMEMQGKLDGAYGLVAGGMALFVNTEGHENLAAVLRKYPLAAVHDVEIIPLVDADGLIEAHLESR